ncbi:MAG: hypothetical protein V4485_01140 [Pseudomonadota bacterium]
MSKSGQNFYNSADKVQSRPIPWHLVRLDAEAFLADSEEEEGEIILPLLHTACSRESVDKEEIQRLVKERNADELNERDVYGRTALALAVSIPDQDTRLWVMEILLESGIHPEFYGKNNAERTSPLILSLTKSSEERCGMEIELLLNHGADIFTNIDYENSLFIAARHGYTEAAMLILQKATKEGCVEAITALGVAYENHTVQASAINNGHPEFVAPYEEYLQQILGALDNHQGES